MATIYEQIETLTQEVETLKTQISGMSAKALTSGADLNALGVGNYYIPNTATATSLLNKPANANAATGYIEVVEGGNSGQLMQYYRPCAKEGASYWQRSYYEGAWGDWNEINVFDSGWLDLTLSGNVIAFNDEQKPRYRRIGKEVFISGVVKNISANETLIATIPVNYRPSKKVIIAVPSTGTKFSRISINTNGAMYYEQSSDNTIAAGNWVSVSCNYNVAD
jgi:hypothetical protein